MAEVMSMIPDETPAGELNADEQESLQVGEQLEAQEEQRLAGKYKNAQELEAAYIELQKKLGEQPEAEEQVTEEPKEEDLLPTCDHVIGLDSTGYAYSPASLTIKI